MEFEGQLKACQSLARYNSWRVGGAARFVYQPTHLMDLSRFLGQWRQTDAILWLGLGSNVLIRDEGFNGLVIAPTQRLKAIDRLDHWTVRAEVGVIAAKFARFCADQGLGESEFFAGIPGTVGGALAMNAGAFGGETWDYVTAVETIDRFGHIRLKTPDAFNVSYRHVETPAEEWFAAGYFAFPPAVPEVQRQAIKALLQKRASKQPIGKYNCGSVFRNPEGGYAAQLIEQAGFKGFRQGGAYVSEKHANFIINDGSATAEDIEQLIESIQIQVFEQFNCQLKREVHVYGNRLLTV